MSFWERLETDDFILGYSYLLPLCRYTQHFRVEEWFNQVTKQLRAYLIARASGELVNHIIIDWTRISDYLPIEDYELLQRLCQMHTSILSSPYFTPEMFPFGRFSDDLAPNVIFQLAELDYLEPEMLTAVPHLLEYHLKSLEALVVHFRIVPLGTNSVKFLGDRLSSRLNHIALKTFSFSAVGPIFKMANIKVVANHYNNMASDTLINESRSTLLGGSSKTKITARLHLLRVLFERMLEYQRKYDLVHPLYEMTLQFHKNTFFRCHFFSSFDKKSRVSWEEAEFDPNEDVLFTKLTEKSSLSLSLQIRCFQFSVLLNTFSPPPLLPRNVLLFLRAWKTATLRGWTFLLRMLEDGEYQSCLFNILLILESERDGSDTDDIIDYFYWFMENANPTTEQRMIKKCLQLLLF